MRRPAADAGAGTSINDRARRDAQRLAGFLNEQFCHDNGFTYNELSDLYSSTTAASSASAWKELGVKMSDFIGAFPMLFEVDKEAGRGTVRLHPDRYCFRDPADDWADPNPPQPPVPPEEAAEAIRRLRLRKFAADPKADRFYENLQAFAAKQCGRLFLPLAPAAFPPGFECFYARDAASCDQFLKKHFFRPSRSVQSRSADARRLRPDVAGLAVLEDFGLEAVTGVFGLDTEGTGPHVLQLSSQNACLVYQISNVVPVSKEHSSARASRGCAAADSANSGSKRWLKETDEVHKSSHPPLLVKMLCCRQIQKVGFNIAHDARLLAGVGLELHGTVDVGVRAQHNGHARITESEDVRSTRPPALGNRGRGRGRGGGGVGGTRKGSGRSSLTDQYGLREIVACYLNARVAKPNSVLLADWGGVLNSDMVAMAGLDAYLSLAAHEVIDSTRPRSVDGSLNKRFCIYIPCVEVAGSSAPVLTNINVAPGVRGAELTEEEAAIADAHLSKLEMSGPAAPRDPNEPRRPPADLPVLETGWGAPEPDPPPSSGAGESRGGGTAAPPARRPHLPAGASAFQKFLWENVESVWDPGPESIWAAAASASADPRNSLPPQARDLLTHRKAFELCKRMLNAGHQFCGGNFTRGPVSHARLVFEEEAARR